MRVKKTNPITGETITYIRTSIKESLNESMYEDSYIEPKIKHLDNSSYCPVCERATPNGKSQYKCSHYAFGL